jgi:hypothetical protein
MPKVPLSTITSGYGTVDALNANFDAIEDAFDNTLSRDGDTPNQMSANLDMNGFLILNQANPYVVDGLNWRGNWVTATAYALGDIVQTNGIAYICIVAHTSGVFATDLAAVRWQVFVQTNLPTQTGNSGRYLSTNGTSASWENVVIPDTSVTTAKVANDAVTFPKMQNIATARLLGRASAGTGDVEELTGAQATELLSAASETVSGRVELADATEAAAGTDTTRALSPARLRDALAASGSAPMYACRAWVNFNGTGTVAIRASRNVSSITDNGTGDYTVNFTTAMPDANYSFNVTGGPASIASGNQTWMSQNATTNPTTTSFRILSQSMGAGGSTYTNTDPSFVHCAVFR